MASATSTKLPKSATSVFTFQLPALQLHHDSLTDGTDIPPPPPSPPPKAIANKPPTTSTMSLPLASSPAPTPAQVARAPKPRIDSSLSPSAKRSGSVRKLLSFRSLSHGNRSSESLNLPPGSPTASLISRPSLSRKRSSLLWGRKKGDALFDGSGAGGVLEEERADDKNKSPAPKLPELEKFGVAAAKSDGEFLGGGEMFRDIK